MCDAGDISRLREIVTRLRSPGGCSWDREQTHESLRAALIEECFEAVEAIDLAQDANLREELGDLLLHVVMHAQMAGERKAFQFDDVVRGICEKLVRRHPHVFGEAVAKGSPEVLRQWEQLKRLEKPRPLSAMDDLPVSFPALLRAQHAQRRAAGVGFDWNDSSPVFDKLAEEVAELREAVSRGVRNEIEEELGDLLFTAVNLARKLGVDAETALTGATRKFIGRFRAVEKEIVAGGGRIEQTLPIEMDALWDKHKAATSSAR